MDTPERVPRRTPQGVVHQSTSEGKAVSVLLVIGGLEVGGAERVLSDMANFWSEKGRAVTLATWNAASDTDFFELDSRVRRVCLGASGRWSMLRSMAALRRFVERERPDVVLSFIDKSNILSLLSTTGFRVPVVISVRTNPALTDTLSGPWKMARWLLYRRATRVIAQTSGAAGWLTTHCGVDAAVIENPLRQLPEPVGDREKLVLGVGRLVELKGFDALIRAFAQSSGPSSGWRMVIIGNGPEHQELLSLAASFGLADRVQIVRRCDNVESWMMRASVYVHAARYEGFPNALAEAMAMGAAVIATDCDFGPGDIVTDGVDGFLVPVDDIEALAARLNTLIEDPDRRMSFGDEALRVREKLEQAKIMSEWERCLLSEGRASV